MAEEFTDLADSIQKGHELEKARKERFNDEISKLQNEKDMMESEVKAPYVVFLATNSRGSYNPEDLQKLPLEILKKLKSNFVDAVNTGYDAILEERERQRKEDAKAKWGANGTGAYDSSTGKWVGGLPQSEEEE